MNPKALLLAPANGALFLASCALIGTGLLLELKMDEEDGAVRLLGMGRDDWGEIHLALALGTVVLVGIHLLLNASWIKAALTRERWTLPMLAASLGLVAALFLWPTDRKGSPDDQPAAHRQQDDD
jgi:hypothetical protein